MKILITGSAGFIGYHLANRLSQDEVNQIWCLDNFSRGERDTQYVELLVKKNVNEISFRENVYKSLIKFNQSFDIIFHFGAINGTQNFYARPFAVLEASSAPTLDVLKFIQNKNFKTKLIFAGTPESYAATIQRDHGPLPTGENVDLLVLSDYEPRWSYAVAKTFSEYSIKSFSDEFELEYMILRFHNIYGTRMGDKHFVPDVLERLRQNDLRIFGVDQTRSFMYIDDAVNSIVKLIKNRKAYGQTINIGSDREITIREAADVIKNALGLKAEIIGFPGPSGSVFRRVPEISKLKSLINLGELITFEDGIKKIINA
jgi:nucleoside-diphosphate-sugar epimerase